MNVTSTSDAPGGQDVRQVLCDAALELLVDGGIAAFDLDAVDGRAGLPPGTCRRNFHNQGELFASFLERTARMYHVELRDSCRRHPDDVVAGITQWLIYVVGPARQRSQVVWALLLDPGTRAQIAMYADALQVRWDREVASCLGIPAGQAGVAWAMVEGWIGRSLLHDLPTPSQETLAGHVRALLRVHTD